jgi:methionine synthase I (cobalamin-dependent)
VDDFPYPLPMLLDGGAVTNLTAAGMPAGVCMEQWAADHPQVLRQVQQSFLAAGSDAVLAPTFRANRAGLAPHGLAGKTESLNCRLVALSRENAAGHPVGALVGPTGLYVPPFGCADFDDIYEIYREQVRALEKAGADFLLAGSQTALSDMRALVLASRTNDLPVFVTISVDENGHTKTGARLLPVLLTLQAMGADAVGLNFTCTPNKMLRRMEDAASHAVVPLIARPGNTQLKPQEWAAAMRRLMDAGASIAGGCLYTKPEHIRALKALLRDYVPPKVPKEPDCNAAAIESEAFFLGDSLTFSEPLSCSAHLGDDLIAMDDDPAGAALVYINDLADAKLLSDAAHMTRKPIAVLADRKPVLEAALRYFQGRLIIDSRCALAPEVLGPLAAKYGAILY